MSEEEKDIEPRLTIVEILNDNLYEELKEFCNPEEDIFWVGTRKYRIDTDDFIKLAKKTDYDSGFGSAKIASDLIIVLLDGTYLTRAEHDGSEWFEHHVRPALPQEKREVLSLTGGLWPTLEEAQEHHLKEQEEKENE